MKPSIAASCLLLLVGAVLGLAPNPLDLIPDRIVLAFDDPGDAEDWVTVNDDVMGGRSTGGFEVKDDKLIFSGSTNTNGGGFSSIRTRPASWGFDDADGLLFRVRGDGREYIASIQTGARMGGYEINYWADFETTDNGYFETVRIPFGEFSATFMGQDVSGRAPRLDPARAETIGFFIYDKKDGPFSLEVEWIGTYTDDDPAAEDPDTLSERMSATPVPTRARMLIERAIERGVPRFNQGDHGACADIYEIAIASLVSRPEGLPAGVVDTLEHGLDEGRHAGNQTERAWAYRRAMDAAYAELMPDPRLNAMAD